MAVAGFVDAVLVSPLGVSLLAVLEAGRDAEAGWSRSAPGTSPASVAAAVVAVGSMSFGELVDAVVYAAVIEAGPWISEAPSKVAAAYRHAEARAPIAEAVDARFGEALHAPLDRSAQQWWTDSSPWSESLAPLFHDFDHVYGAGQFTWAGLWTVTDPPPEAQAQVVAAWEYETPPVRRCSLPVRPEARVFEVHRAEDWARLVAEHPREGRPHPEWELPGPNQRRHRLEKLLAVPGQRAARPVICRHLVPDWWSVAERYDGVHLSWAGLVTAEGCVTDLGGGDVALMRYWFSERAHWLADVFGEPRPLPGPVLDRPAPRSTPGRSRTALDPSHVLARLLGRGGAPARPGDGA